VKPFSHGEPLTPLTPSVGSATLKNTTGDGDGRLS
jgi:hypothetical protein